MLFRSREGHEQTTGRSDRRREGASQTGRKERIWYLLKPSLILERRRTGKKKKEKRSRSFSNCFFLSFSHSLSLTPLLSRFLSEPKVRLALKRKVLGTLTSSDSSTVVVLIFSNAKERLDSKQSPGAGVCGQGERVKTV